jgi:hypothetical protein
MNTFVTYVEKHSQQKIRWVVTERNIHRKQNQTAL